MALMEWNESLELGVGPMDRTHREFVDILNGLGEADDAEFLARLDFFIEHTEAHFAQETRWMQDVRFPPIHCHEGEHENVLKVMHDVRAMVAKGDFHIGRVLVSELPEWFRLHAATMDAALAHYIKTLHYDAVQGATPQPAVA